MSTQNGKKKRMSLWRDTERLRETSLRWLHKLRERGRIHPPSTIGLSQLDTVLLSRDACSPTDHSLLLRRSEVDEGRRSATDSSIPFRKALSDDGRGICILGEGREQDC